MNTARCLGKGDTKVAFNWRKGCARTGGFPKWLAFPKAPKFHTMNCLGNQLAHRLATRDQMPAACCACQAPIGNLIWRACRESQFPRGLPIYDLAFNGACTEHLLVCFLGGTHTWLEIKLKQTPWRQPTVAVSLTSADVSSASLRREGKYLESSLQRFRYLERLSSKATVPQLASSYLSVCGYFFYPLPNSSIVNWKWAA